MTTMATMNAEALARWRQTAIDAWALGRVAVLMGGRSAEREISLMSGKGVLAGGLVSYIAAMLFVGMGLLITRAPASTFRIPRTALGWFLFAGCTTIHLKAPSEALPQLTKSGDAYIHDPAV